MYSFQIPTDNGVPSSRRSCQLSLSLYFVSPNFGEVSLSSRRKIFNWDNRIWRHGLRFYWSDLCKYL